MPKDTLCVLPFMHLNVMPAGTVHPCCASPMAIRDAIGTPLNIRTHTLDAIWKSAGLREIRTAMLHGEEPPHCADCYRVERQGFASVRTNYNALILDAKPTPSASFASVDRASLKEDMGPPTYFDLRFDNVCNLKCVICFASESSSIERDPVHMAWTGEREIERYPNRFDNPAKWVASDDLLAELKAISANAQYVRLAGGEPFRSALALRWLDHLVRSGQAKAITLQVYTNFTLFNERLISLLAAFKVVSLVLSIDGTGDTYEYVRYPAKWSRIEENARLLVAEQQGRLRHLGVSINATMSIPSAMRIIDLFEWAGRHKFGMTLSNAVEPRHVSTRYLPQAAKHRLERDLRAYAARTPSLKHLPSQIDQWMTDMYTVNTAEQLHVPAFHDAMRFLNDMDKTRGLDFRRLQPELVAEFEAEAGTWVAGNRHSGAGDTGVVQGNTLVVADRTYECVPYSGGAIERFEEGPLGYLVSGWAMDSIARRDASAIAVAIGDDVVCTALPTSIRPDIEGGFGAHVRPSGFEITVAKRGNRPTIEEPMRFFALTADGCAAPLAADFPAMPITAAPFTMPAPAPVLAEPRQISRKTRWFRAFLPRRD